MNNDRRPRKSSDPIKPWFEAVASTGDSTTILFGHMRPGSSEIEWHSLPHSEYDGIGGFGHLLRSHGVKIDLLPQNRHLPAPSWKPFFRSMPKLVGLRRRLQWKELDQEAPPTDNKILDPALAWHIFTEDETSLLLDRSRGEEVTLNTLLLKHLDRALRPDLVSPGVDIPWMVPVNLRGQLQRDRDTENHSSYLSVRISPEENAADLHAEIYRKIGVGEPWANWKAYSATRFIPQLAKRAMVRSGRATAEWNLGVMTNLGAWDTEKQIVEVDLAGSWLIVAPALRFLTVAVGVMTFQGRLSLTIQAHRELTTSRDIANRWIARWVEALISDRA